MKHFYPAVFTQEDNGYSVTFPDMEGCFTEGNTLEDAYQMAFDAIGLYMESENKASFIYPTASSPKSIPLQKDEFVVLIEFDEMEYRKKHDGKAVKKTLTIPSWLNAMAEENNVNFSQILQAALKDYLHVSR